MSTPTLPSPVQRVIDAINEGDTRTFLDMFTAHGAVVDWGREFRGPDAIRNWSDSEFIGKQVNLIVTDVQEEDDDIIMVSAQVGGGGFKGPSDFTFTLDGDKIALMNIAG